jgi:hypothetical protein
MRAPALGLSLAMLSSSVCAQLTQGSASGSPNSVDPQGSGPVPRTGANVVVTGADNIPLIGADAGRVRTGDLRRAELDGIPWVDERGVLHHERKLNPSPAKKLEAGSPLIMTAAPEIPPTASQAPGRLHQASALSTEMTQPPAAAVDAALSAENALSAQTAPLGAHHRAALNRAQALETTLRAQSTAQPGGLAAPGPAAAPAGAAAAPRPLAGPGQTASVPAARPFTAAPAAPAPAPAPAGGLSLIAAASSGFMDSFRSLALHVGRTPDGNLAVLDSRGRQADGSALAALKANIAESPRALLTRPDFFSVISPSDYSQLKSLVVSPPASAKHGLLLRDLGVSAGGRDIVWTASCSRVSGECNPAAAESSYRKNQPASPESLRAVAAQFKRLASVAGWAAAAAGAAFAPAVGAAGAGSGQISAGSAPKKDDDWAAYVRQQKTSLDAAAKEGAPPDAAAAADARALARLRSKSLLQRLSDMVSSSVGGEKPAAASAAVSAGEAGAQDGAPASASAAAARADGAPPSLVRPGDQDASLIDAGAAHGVFGGLAGLDRAGPRTLGLGALAAGAFLLGAAAWLSSRRRAVLLVPPPLRRPRRGGSAPRA